MMSVRSYGGQNCGTVTRTWSESTPSRWGELRLLRVNIMIMISKFKLGSYYSRLPVLSLNYWPLLPNIWYYCYYFVCEKFGYNNIICYYCTRAQNINYCNYSKTIIAIILLCYQLFALLQLIDLFLLSTIIGIIYLTTN